VNRHLQTALLAVYRGIAARGLLAGGPGRRLFEAAYFGYKRHFEAGSPKRLEHVIAEGSTVIDVGANIGFYAVPFARRVGPQGRVIAFEPERANHRRLTARIAAAGLADRALLFEAAAAERSGRLRLAVNPDHPGDHKLAPDGAEGGVEIAAHALDDLLAAHPGPPVSLVKIDVQGAELRVIRGARDLIGRDRPALFVEIDPDALASMGDSVEALIAMMDRLGYVGRVWTRHGQGAVLDAGNCTAIGNSYVDALFVPADTSSPTGTSS